MDWLYLFGAWWLGGMMGMLVMALAAAAGRTDQLEEAWRAGWWAGQREAGQQRADENHPPPGSRARNPASGRDGSLTR